MAASGSLGATSRSLRPARPRLQLRRRLGSVLAAALREAMACLAQPNVRCHNTGHRY
jgi:hypothetical protein